MAPRGAQRCTVGPSVEHTKPEDTIVVGERAVEVGDLKPHGANMGCCGKTKPRRGDAVALGDRGCARRLR